ncbi:MAG: hypothetical protein RIF33_02235 [Cyclobacteriaceae bacterium]
MRTHQLFFLFLSIITSIQCSEKDEESALETTEELPRVRGSWSPYWSDLYHDGAPYESENFIVYSDKSSDQWRITVAGLAEKALVDIKTHLNVEAKDFDFVSTQLNKKIHILTNFDQWNIAVAYRDGIIIRSKDGPNFFGDHETWQKVFEHELTHVVEFLLIGDFNFRQANTVWMREGFGNYGARNFRIQTLAQLTEWQKKMQNVAGEGNPIDIRSWGNFPQSVIDSGTTGEYYGFFELAVRYLVDEEHGNGTSIEDLKAYLEDLGKGVDQDAAFTEHFGISQVVYRNDFWSLMEVYLSE